MPCHSGVLVLDAGHYKGIQSVNNMQRHRPTKLEHALKMEWTTKDKLFGWAKATNAEETTAARDGPVR